jgi:hypothetical protein
MLMADLSPSGVSSFLPTLRTFPIWVLGGLALAGYAVLYVPAFGGIDPTGFRTQRGVDRGIEFFDSDRRARRRRRRHELDVLPPKRIAPCNSCHDIANAGGIWPN